MFPQSIQHPLESVDTVQLEPLGRVFFDKNGKGYRYVAFPLSAALTAGELLVAPAAPSNSTGLALPTTNTTAQLSSGSRSLIVTNGATSVTANQFAGGQLEVLGTNGIGQAYRIAGNSSAGNGGAITVTLDEPLRNTTALANGTNTVNLRQNPAFQPTASTTAAKCVGVTIMPVASSATQQYGWVQIFGEAYCNATSGTKDQPVAQDVATTAGNVANVGAGASETSEVIGYFLASASSTLASVFLQMV